MKKTGFENLLEHQIHPEMGDQRKIVFGPQFRVLQHLGGGIAEDPFHGQDFGCGVIQIQFRNHQPRRILHAVGESEQVGRFELVVQFPPQGVGEFPDDLDRFVAGQRFVEVLQLAGDIQHDIEIEFDGLLDPGPLDFDYHFRPVMKAGGMDLADAGGCQRLFGK